MNDIFEWLNLKKINLTNNIFNKSTNNTSSNHLNPESIDDLSNLYIESIIRLENLLGSKIDPWRNLEERGIKL